MDHDDALHTERSKPPSKLQRQIEADLIAMVLLFSSFPLSLSLSLFLFSSLLFSSLLFSSLHTNSLSPPSSSTNTILIFQTSPLFLPRNQYVLKTVQLTAGYASNSFIQHSSSIFYCSPTIAPVEYSSLHPTFLEHPQSAFDYYRAQGVHRVCASPIILSLSLSFSLSLSLSLSDAISFSSKKACEHKYMGSRAQICIFRDSITRVADDLSKIQIVSRSGAPFFPSTSPIPEEWRQELNVVLEVPRLLPLSFL